MTLLFKERLADSGRTRALVIFLHGYGADGADLLGLSAPLAPHLPDVSYLAPDGPEPCRSNPHGFQWFPIPWVDGSDETEAAAALARSSNLLSAWLDEVITARGVAPGKVALVGFSQGTMMALHVGPVRGAGRAGPMAGIVGFSGRLLSAEAARAAPFRPPVLLVHGDADDIVPYAELAKAEKALATAGYAVETLTEPGMGHGIGPAGLNAALARLKAWLLS
jgi:phospholipase/carboxylesterase